MIPKKIVLGFFLIVVGVVRGAEPLKETPLLPSGWHVHDEARPQPEIVIPGKWVGEAPSDAITLFDGQDLDLWAGIKQGDREKPRYNPEGLPLWKVENGYVECTPTGDILTRMNFGDCQLHVEWRVDPSREKKGQGQGNSGVFFMGKYEVQILDSYENPTYADGSAGAVYGQTPPLVNALHQSEKWQTYDIVFQAPRFEGNVLISPAYVTVFVNGVLAQYQTEILGPTVWRARADYKVHPDKLPLRLQDHNNRNRFRNIWIRELHLGRE